MLLIRDMFYAGVGPVNLSVDGGVCIGVMGLSGSGKTRFLRALSDLDVWEGEILLNDRTPHSMLAHFWRRKAGYLPAESLWWYDRVREHFSELPEERHCHELGFDADVMNWDISRLSSGEKQRLGLLRLLQNRPEMLLLDEPTAHVDAEMTVQMEKLIRNWWQKHNLPVLWVSHEHVQLERVASRLFIMDGGRLHEGEHEWN